MKISLKINSNGKITRPYRPLTIGFSVYETVGVPIINPRTIAKLTIVKKPK